MTTEFLDCPMPNDALDGSTVIASGYLDDEVYGVLLLNANTPFYRIATVTSNGELSRVKSFPNIVPAARFFDEVFGFWGG